jgi:hypothetical protein
MSVPVVTIWCSECAGGQRRPIAYVTRGSRGFWLMSRNLGYLKKRNPFTTNLSKVWARPDAHGSTRMLRCSIHGERTLDLTQLERTVRERKSATRSEELSV